MITSGIGGTKRTARRQSADCAETALSRFQTALPAAFSLTQDASAIEQLLALLDCCHGHDFSHYKQSLLLRSMKACMRESGTRDPRAYLLGLEGQPAMLQRFLSKLLVRVTRFFRDPDAFSTLGTDVLPALLASQPPGHIFRAWVPGCSTGEEACSLAILLRELADPPGAPFDFRIVATDIDASAIAHAQAGIFSPSTVRDLSPARRQRFFTRQQAGYQITRELRAKISFTFGNVQTQPSFRGLDLISCRNVLIYFDQELQDRLFTLFHGVLHPGGILFLAPSESVSKRTDLFAPLNRKWRLYRSHGHPPASRRQLFGSTQGCHLDPEGWRV